MASFATSLACMDGRVQTPLRDWINQKSGAEFVDTITQPGLDAILAGRGPGGSKNPGIELIRNMLSISTEKHHSNFVAISGHHDCAGNPVDAQTHKEHIEKAVGVVQRWVPKTEVVGVWVGDDWSVKPI